MLISALYLSKSVFISPFTIYELHLASNSSIPPFVYTKYFSPTLFTVVINFLSESNGISFTLFNSKTSFTSKLILNPKSINAVSVGSPVNSLSAPIFVSLHNVHTCINLSSSLLIALISLASTTSLFTNTF